MDIQNLYQSLHGLDAKLRAEGMKSGPDVWLLVFRLLERLQQQGRLPDEPKGLVPLLGPLFCRHPEDQARFPVIFEQWLGGPSLASFTHMASPEQQPITQARVKIRKAAWMWSIVALVLSGLLTAWIISQPKDTTGPFMQPPVTTQPGPDEPPTPQPLDQPKTPLENRVPPRLLPEPLPQAWVVAGQGVDHGLDGLPWVLALIWLASRYHRQWILRTQAPSGGELLNHLHFKRLLAPIFGGSEAERAMRELRAAHLEPTRRLDIAATVEATARHGDYFQPVYRNRRVAPEYLLLVQSAHRNDQQAALAEELAERFRGLGLTVRAYRFRDDPRFLVRWLENDGEYVDLAQLAARHGTARLLVIGEAQLLFHPYSGEVRPWLDELAAWQNPVWLHPRNAGAEHAELLSRHKFLLLPLSRDSLPVLVARLTNSPLPSGEAQASVNQALSLPDMIVAEPGSWLGEKPPYGSDLAGLVRQLEQFLGTYGLRLLRGVAVYPRPNWDLTLALDFLLYGKLDTADPPQRREQRLARLSRLPWLTRAHLPDWLREHLLRGMNDEERQRIVTVWRDLFGQLTDSESFDTLRLDIKTPNKRQVKLRLADLRSLRPTQFDDPIFVNILLGGRLGFLDFELPRAVARLLPGGRWLISLKPLLMALALAGLSVWGGNTLWDVYGRDFLVAVSVATDNMQNKGWTVSLSAGGDAQALMQAVKTRLQAAGFTTVDEAKMSDVNSQNLDRLQFPPGGEAAARRVEEMVTHTAYGATIDSQAKADLADHSLVLQLAHTHQPGAKFHDAMAYPWHPDPAKQPPALPPEMVQIPAGEFMMGTDPSEAGSSKNEQPRHLVKIKAFSLGKYEVTQGQWQAVMGSNPSYFKQCGDNCPVENVNFNDVQTFIQKLNAKTGSTYRLPTEAEWEYAARAGTTTAFSTGDCITTRQANYDGNYDYNDCGAKTGVFLGKTAPVGSYPANPWGLYDMHGNVWEWTCSAYTEQYDGSESICINDANNVRRVIRGGSWDIDPVYLRSANRNGDSAANRYSDIGFRLAQDL